MLSSQKQFFFQLQGLVSYIPKHLPKAFKEKRFTISFNPLDFSVFDVFSNMLPFILVMTVTICKLLHSFFHTTDGFISFLFFVTQIMCIKGAHLRHFLANQDKTEKVKTEMQRIQYPTILNKFSYTDLVLLLYILKTVLITAAVLNACVRLVEVILYLHRNI